MAAAAPNTRMQYQECRREQRPCRIAGFLYAHGGGMGGVLAWGGSIPLAGTPCLLDCMQSDRASVTSAGRSGHRS